MAKEPTPDELRAMAEHRGLKLLRSRKRTPGVGDYGKFGLTDADGKALLGIGNDGLTASAGDIEQYLRGGTVSSWKLSADTAPAPRRPKTKRAQAPDDTEGAPVRRRTAPKRAMGATAAETRRQYPPPPPRAKPKLRIVEPEPAAELIIRTAKPGDIKALGSLLAQLAKPPKRIPLDANVAALSKAGGGLVVAEKGKPIGLCAWAVLPTLQHGAVGRITLLLVDAKFRREGVATELLQSAEGALRKAGCDRIEAMSDIMINNAHNFFRARGFEQASYRFVRSLD